MTMTDYRLGIELNLPTSEQENIVVDAGFDNYVRSVWEQLARGESVHFPLLLADLTGPSICELILKHPVTATRQSYAWKSVWIPGCSAS